MKSSGRAGGYAAPRSERRLGAGLLAAGCLPFAAGALIAPPVESGFGGLPCPFLAVTGLPCPLCGSTRSFALAARGDPALFGYNAVWVALAAAAVLAGLFALGASLLGTAPLSRARARLALARRSPAWVLAAIALAAVPPWAYALVRTEAIAGG